MHSLLRLTRPSWATTAAGQVWLAGTGNVGGTGYGGTDARHPLDAAGELELWEDGRRQRPSAVFLLYVRGSHPVP
jgi:hypothetical protein